MNKHTRFHLKNLSDLSREAEQLNVTIPLSEETSILFTPLRLAGGLNLVNRFAVHPMEGFDADTSGRPGKLSFRRYKRYAAGGAALIWFEACAVVPEARSNPHQFCIHKDNVALYKQLTSQVRTQAAKSLGPAQKPLLILQLTHSGRYSKPTGKPAPLIAHHSPILDPRDNLPADYPLVSDDYLDKLQDHFVTAAKLAAQAGFDGVDIKSCHRYLVSELHASFTRENSKYGGSYENRTRFIRETAAVIRQAVDEVFITTRMNVYDALPYPYGFGVAEQDQFTPDLREPLRLIGELKELGLPLLNISIGNPYYEPHFGRPYDFPVKGAPLPDMHPLENIAKFLDITRRIQQADPGLPVLGGGYSWLRQFIPNVGAAVIKAGWASILGQGRNSFAYPDSIRDLQKNGEFDKKKVCVSCSCCTQIMRDGGQTGCVVHDSAIYAPEYRRLRKQAIDTLRAEAARCRDCAEPTCQEACPARINIPAFIKAFERDDIAGAYGILKEANCFPETCAYICPVEVQCEGGCLEQILSRNPIPIREIQKKVAIMARELGLTGVILGPDKQQTLAVLGAGPAGLACTATLLEAGYHVDLYDQNDQYGGTPAEVIPPYRLSQEETLLEIHSILSAAEQAGRLRGHFRQGITLKHPLGVFTEKYPAVFLGMGLGKAYRLKPDQVQPEGVMDAITFLKQAKHKNTTILPETVCVLGGGNTAMDAAVTAKENGARDVFLIYRRSFTELPAWPAERDKALAAGVQFLILTQPLDYVVENQRVTGLKTARTVLEKSTSTGRRRPVLLENSEAVLPAQLIIEALGQEPLENIEKLLTDITLENGKWIHVDTHTRQTSNPKVFAGGDITNGGSTAVQAIHEGILAAKAMDNYCRNTL